MSNARNERRDLETPVIDLFEKVAFRYTRNTQRKQKKENQVQGTVFQFGDLRVNAPSCYILIEAESGGGVTNLVKYWYCLEEKKIDKPVRLLHIFSIETPKSWKTHRDLWESLARKMENALGHMFVAELYTYTYPKEQEDLEKVLEPILKEFERMLEEAFFVHKEKQLNALDRFIWHDGDLILVEERRSEQSGN